MSVIKGVWIRVENRIILAYDLRVWSCDPRGEGCYAVMANDNVCVGHARNKKEANQILDEFGKAIIEGCHFLRIYDMGKKCWHDRRVLGVAKMQTDCRGMLGETLELLEEE